jgi:hypothetical protein
MDGSRALIFRLEGINRRPEIHESASLSLSLSHYREMKLAAPRLERR